MQATITLPELPAGVTPDERGIRCGAFSEGDWYINNDGRWHCWVRPNKSDLQSWIFFTPVSAPKSVVGFSAGVRFAKDLVGRWQWCLKQDGKKYGLVMQHHHLAYDILNALPPSITEFTTTEDGVSL